MSESNLITSFLKACAARLDLVLGRRIHASLIQSTLHTDPFIAASLITLYSKCGSIADAHKVFDQLSHRDPTVWNAILTAQFHHRRPIHALSLLRRMHLTGVRPDAHSLSILLSTHLTINFIKPAHTYIVTNAFCGDPFLDIALVDTFLKSGAAVFEACKVFDELVNKSFFTWNTMISGFSHIGLWERSLEMFARMRREEGQPQAATFSSVLTTCSGRDDVDSGEGILCLVVKFGFELDPYVCTSLLTMYAR